MPADGVDDSERGRGKGRLGEGAVLTLTLLCNCSDRGYEQQSSLDIKRTHH